MVGCLIPRDPKNEGKLRRRRAGSIRSPLKVEPTQRDEILASVYHSVIRDGFDEPLARSIRTMQAIYLDYVEDGGVKDRESLRRLFDAKKPVGADFWFSLWMRHQRKLGHGISVPA
jgi:hypothetical protein